jgi:hypothetical protein
VRQIIRSSDLLILLPSVQHAEDGRDKEQGGDGGKQQAANHRPAQWGVLLSPLTHAQGHRSHADNHGQRRHDDQPKTGKAGLQRRHRGIDAASHLFLGKTHHQNAVGSGHTYAHQGRDQGWDADDSLDGKKEPDDSRQSGWQSLNDDQRVLPGLEVHHN